MNAPAPDHAGPGGLSDARILVDLQAIARKSLDWEGSLTPEMTLVDAMELDSVRLLTLVVEVEDHFEICLEESDEIGLETVADLMAVIRARKAADVG